MARKSGALRAVEEPAQEDAGRALEFAPVPRKYRYDGWTPERQKAFISALATTGCVTRAARMVNIAQTNCYELRKAPGAEEFRRAWDAALDFGLKRLKDIAFERAIEGELVPVFVAGKLLGYRRKYNNALLIFCLRHYGQDANGKRVTVNYFSTRATAGAGGSGGVGGSPLPAGAAPPPPSAVPLPEKSRGGSMAAAEASVATVRTVISGASDGDAAAAADAAAGVVNGFEGVALDAQAAAEIQAAIEACAARARALQEAWDEDGEAAADASEAEGTPFFRSAEPYRVLEPPVELEEFVPFHEGEASWRDAGAEMPAALVEFLDAQAGQAGAAERRA